MPGGHGVLVAYDQVESFVPIEQHQRAAALVGLARRGRRAGLRGAARSRARVGGGVLARARSLCALISDEPQPHQVACDHRRQRRRDGQLPGPTQPREREEARRRAQAAAEHGGHVARRRRVGELPRAGTRPLRRLVGVEALVDQPSLQRRQRRDARARGARAERRDGLQHDRPGVVRRRRVVVPDLRHAAQERRSKKLLARQILERRRGDSRRRGADGRAAFVNGPAADGAARVWRAQGPPEDREAEREEAPPRRAAVKRPRRVRHCGKVFSADQHRAATNYCRDQDSGAVGPHGPAAGRDRPGLGERRGGVEQERAAPQRCGPRERVARVQHDHGRYENGRDRREWPRERRGDGARGQDQPARGRLRLGRGPEAAQRRLGGRRDDGARVERGGGARQDAGYGHLSSVHGGQHSLPSRCSERRSAGTVRANTTNAALARCAHIICHII